MKKTRCAEVGSYYGGVKQRWLLVLHEPTRQRQQATLERRIAKERDQAERALWHLSNREFDCEDAIHKALALLEHGWKYHRAESEITTEQRYTRHGRPTPDVQREVWRFMGRLSKTKRVSLRPRPDTANTSSPPTSWMLRSCPSLSGSTSTRQVHHR